MARRAARVASAFDEAKAQYAVDFVELMKLTGDFHGQPFRLMPWQRKIVSDVYGTINARGVRQYRYVYVECAKKNAKSQLTSGVGNLHLFNPAEPNGQIVLCAGDREQAEQTIYLPLVEMIEQNKTLARKVKITDSKKLIVNKETGTTLKVISAESYSKHGWNISCCIFDELHVQPSRDLYDVMIKGAGLVRRQPIWWVITTAGDDPDRLTIAWEVHEKAESILQARKKGDAEHDLRTWYPVIHAYAGEDIYNERNWKKANPSLGTTVQIEDLRDLADEAKLHPADERLFRWLNLCQWVTTKLSSWLPLDLFDTTSSTEWTRADLLGRDCYIGGDFSTTTDLAATCLVFPPQRGRRLVDAEKDIWEPWEQDDWRVIWDAWIPAETMQQRVEQDHVPYDQWAAAGWLQATEGDVIDYTAIEERILEYKKLYKVKEMGSDPAFAAMLLQRLTQAGLICIEVPQYYTHLTDPINEIERLLRSNVISHEPNPVARWAFGNASVAKNGNAQVKLVKERKGKHLVETKRIDPIIAWVNAMARAKFYSEVPDLSKILDEGWGM